MKVLSKQISNLLFEHDCVIIPGLGGFIANYKPASIHPHNHTFHPPSKQITFNSALTGNDGILVSAFAFSAGIEFNDAARIVEHEVHNLRIMLLKGHKVELEDVGYLIANKENNIEFFPSGKINYLGEAWGLTKFDFNPVNRISDVPIAGINRQVVRKTMKWAAILLPVAAVALWTTLNTGTLDRIVGNYASLIPSNEAAAKVIATKKHVSTFNAADVTAVLKPAIEEDITVIEWGKVSETETMTEIKSVADNTEHVPVLSINNVNSIASVNNFHIIAGAFSVHENAVKLMEQLRMEGYNAQLVDQKRSKLHMVSISSFSSRKEASAALAGLHKNGFPAVWLLGN